MKKTLIILLLSYGFSFAEEDQTTAHHEARPNFSLFENMTLQMQGDSLAYYQKYLLESGTNLHISKTERLEGFGQMIASPGYPNVTINNNGRLTPGLVGEKGALTPGTITIGSSEGNSNSSVLYTQGSEGELRILFNNSESFSQLNLVSGEGSARAVLDGTLEVVGNSFFDIEPGQEVQIVRASSGVSGTFAHIQSVDLPSLVPVVRYFDDYVSLSFSPTLQSYVGGLSEVIFTSINRNNVLLTKHTYDLRSSFSTAQQRLPVAALECFAQGHKPVAPPSSKRKRPAHFYLGPTGSVGNVQSSGSQVGFDYYSVGAIAGFDYSFSQAAVGILLNYDGVEGHIDRGWGKYSTEQLLTSVYGTYVPPSLPALSVDAVVGGGYEWNAIHRNTGTSLNKKRANGAPRSAVFDALLACEYTFSQNQYAWMPENLEWMPLFSLQFINLNLDGYKESGAGGFDLSMGSQHAQSLRTTLEMLVDYRFIFPTWKLSLEADAGWQWEFLDGDRSVSFAPLNVSGPAGSIGVVGAGNSTLLLGADLFFQFKEERLGLKLNYDFEWNSLFYDNYFTLNLSFRW